MNVAGHLMMVTKDGGTRHLAERHLEPVVSKCGQSGMHAELESLWIVGVNACGRCRRIVGREGFTHVVVDHFGNTTEL